MAILDLRWALVAVVAGCYDPAIRDCAVPCAIGAACAGGQVCGAEGYCAGPTVSCAASDARGVDARLTPPDARGLDARPPDARPPDAAPRMGTLRIVIVKRGAVAIAPIGAVCVASGGQGKTCDLDVEVGAAVVLTATTPHEDDTFVGWTTPNCAGQGSTCALTCGDGTTLVGATFASH